MLVFREETMLEEEKRKEGEAEGEEEEEEETRGRENGRAKVGQTRGILLRDGSGRVSA